ncbi:branched-chain amino acid ABC transporter permease [Nocardioides litoris]|uniref:branched-chain amino acid ABC transporter permease n=1 Tax=Nocardioides litoris TaxID=1926648 RepID=UPI001120203A|nr:branched-chain amino acid ABC transporter permease [Nocardioides litoris]
MSMTLVLAGLAIGAIYAIIAYGYNLTVTTAGVLNFANAHMTMIGTFVAAWALTSLGLAVPLVIVVCVLVGAVLGLVVELTAVAPLKSFRLRRGGGVGHGELVTTVGASTIVTGLAYIIWGSDPIQVPLFDDDRRVSFLGGEVRKSDLLVIGTALMLGLVLHVWTQRSRLGLASLAQSEDRDAAMLQGVNVRLLSSAGFVIAGALGSGVGVIVGAKTLAVVSLALVLAIKGFVALTLGGVGSHVGALVGGLALGVGEVMTARWLGSDYRSLMVFVVFMLVLLVRPQGLFGTKEGRTV